MPLIQRSDLVERVRRAFNLVGAGTAGQTLSPELVPVVIVEDLTDPSIDEGFPRDASAFISAGASAGVFSEVILSNPDGSRVDLITYGWWSAMGTAGGYYLRRGPNSNLNNLLGTQTQRYNLDLRTNLRPVGRIDTRNQAAVLTGDLLQTLQATTTLYGGIFMPLTITIPPGQWIELVPSVNNNAMTCHFIWKERIRSGQ